MGLLKSEQWMRRVKAHAGGYKSKLEGYKRKTQNSESGVVMDITETDKNKVWAFCAGQYSNDFRGNPKWLFVYMNKYRKDITTYWLCESDETLALVRSLGYRAYKLHTLQAEEAINLTGVIVSEQVKMGVPDGLEQAKYLNLWHGVGGVKAVEKSLLEGLLLPELAKKYIDKNAYYSQYQLYLATSPFIEEIAAKQLGITEDRMIRAGYPRNIYQKKFERLATFDHDLLKKKGLPTDTRIVAYTPTYRNNQVGELFASSMPDLEKLIEVCEKNHLLFVFKMHPHSEKESSFLAAKEAYADCPWLYFWDNRDDFYEILDKVDLCIMDFSSIFTDFLSAGVKHFVRYIFDIDPETLDFPMGYDEVTLGRKCKTFDELLDALATYEQDDLTDDIARIDALYWKYDDADSMERIVESTLNFQPKTAKLPTLYSFDIFDTLISRKVLAPEGIFYKVKEQMQRSDAGFPADMIKDYVSVRKACERNVRTYYNRSKLERDDERCEIQFREIFECMQRVYPVTEQQIALLMQWEMEAELEDTIPLTERIEYVKELKARGEEVVLISDMYLPKEFIQQMLAKADPLLPTLPLFLSSEYGYQKSAKTLYFEVYKHFAPYPFGRWIHHGDNPHSDVKMPRSLNIQARPVSVPQFNKLEQAMVESIGTYDAFVVAAMMARFRADHPMNRQQFVYNYVSLLFVPYVYWCVHDAIKEGRETLYFISRDGHHLKRIADAIIEAEHLNIQTKYIYASRRTWRIPSFIDHIDVGFWGQGYGNFARVNTFEKLLKAMNMDEETFRRLFPEFRELNESSTFTLPELQQIVDVLKVSPKFLDYILGIAKEQRVASCGYLAQEMDTTKPVSIVEYWGRGYTQENFTRLWQEIAGKDVPSTFYYSRSTLPSDEFNIRKNFTLNPSEQKFIEAIFANMPYKSIEKYEQIDGKWVPEIKALDCDVALFDAMQEYLPRFATDYCALQFNDREAIGRCLIDFAITFYNENQDWDVFVEILAPAMDSVELYGKKCEYAKELTPRDIEALTKGTITRNQLSKSQTMSVCRSSSEMQRKYRELFQLDVGEPLDDGARCPTPEALKRSNRFFAMRDDYSNSLGRIRRAYEAACESTSVQNKVIFLHEWDSIEPLSFRKIRSLLDKQNTFTVKDLDADKYVGKEDELAAELATARFILIEKPVPQISGLRLRVDTKLIVLGDLAVYFRPMGLAKTIWLRSENAYLLSQQKMDIAHLQVASDAMIPPYQRVYSVDEETDYSIKGNCITDLYFDAAFIAESKEKLYKSFPAAKGKKVICYVPAHRFRNKNSAYGDLLDMSLMQRMLGDEYVVILHKQLETARLTSNELEIKNFSKDLTKQMRAREQFAAADIIVGDYRNVVLEAPLLGKPLYLTCWDAHRPAFVDNAMFDYSEFAEGMEVADTADLIARIRSGEYDYTAAKRYMEKYLTYCDGHSADRLYAFLMEHVI